ncbi:MAG: T9SS type A sorting domain-containing protein [Flavobacteriales bacterium]|nr:T9SS type A sorting domain-containing protein [Flavobacteriales bacterium]
MGNNRHSISVADLEAGMYLLMISDGTQSTSRRFVKN